MIIAFKTKDSEALKNFLNAFENPKSVFMELIHNITFSEKKITKIDDITIIEQESFVRLFAKYAMLPAVAMIIIGLFFKYYWLLNFGSILLIFDIILLSRHFFLLTIMIKLKFMGHKEKIEMISDGFLLSKLLQDYRSKNGTTRSVRIIKK